MSAAFSPPLKILVTGAFSTGKTTLVDWLVKHFSDEGLVVGTTPDVARLCPFPLNRSQNVGVSAWLVGEQIRQEAEACLTNTDLVICDRGVPDILSHTDVLILSSEADHRYTAAVNHLCKAWVSTYDAVLWATMDPDRAIAADGLRVTDPGYQSELQEVLTQVFAKLGVDAARLPSDDTARQCAAVELITSFRSAADGRGK